MSERIKCKVCDNMILPVTAKHQNGLCGPCSWKEKAKNEPPTKREFRGKFDNVSWHYGSTNFPKDLNRRNGGTHIGMFIAWAFLHDFAGDDVLEYNRKEVEKVRSRTMTGCEFLMAVMDEKFNQYDLSENCIKFAIDYYWKSEAQYFEDFQDALVTVDLPSGYHVDDTWENYDELEPFIDQAYKEWKTKAHSF